MAQPQTYGTTPDTGTSDTVDLTREESRQVADDAKRQAGDVAGTAREQASGVANEALGHAKDLAGNAKEQLHSQARQQTDAFGGALNTFGGRVQALADGNVEAAGPVGDYAQRLAGQVEHLAGRVDELGFDGMIDQVQSYARRKPGAFLLGAAVAGLAVSRLARGAQSARPASSDHGSTLASSNAGTWSSSPPAARPAPSAPSTATGMSSGASVGTPPPPPMPNAATPVPAQTDEFGRTGR